MASELESQGTGEDEVIEMTNDDLPGFIAELPPRQEKALYALCEGKPVTHAAMSAGVSRMTIYNWQTRDARFMAAMNVFRQQAREAVERRMATMVEEAMRVLGDCLLKGEFKAAMAVLKYLDKHPAGSGHADEVARVLEAKKQPGARTVVETKPEDEWLIHKLNLERFGPHENERYVQEIAKAKAQEKEKENGEVQGS